MQQRNEKDGGDSFLRTARRDAPGRTANARCVAVLSPYAIPQARRVIRHP